MADPRPQRRESGWSIAAPPRARPPPRDGASVHREALGMSSPGSSAEDRAVPEPANGTVQVEEHGIAAEASDHDRIDGGSSRGIVREPLAARKRTGYVPRPTASRHELERRARHGSTSTTCALRPSLDVVVRCPGATASPASAASFKRRGVVRGSGRCPSSAARGPDGPSGTKRPSRKAARQNPDERRGVPRPLGHGTSARSARWPRPPTRFCRRTSLARTAPPAVIPALRFSRWARTRWILPALVV